MSLAVIADFEQDRVVASSPEPAIDDDVKSDADTTRLALVVGINEYGDGIPPLRNATRDAHAVAQVLVRHHRYELLEAYDAEATADALWALLATVREKATAQHDVIIYFAGHGTAEPDEEDGLKGYLLPVDAARSDRKRHLPMDEIRKALRELRCRHLLVLLDCCFAGLFGRTPMRDLSPLMERPLPRERFEWYRGRRSFQLIASAAHDEKALDAFQLRSLAEQDDQHSPFAQAILDGLSQMDIVMPDGRRVSTAAADRNGDRVLTGTELYVFLLDRVGELVHGTRVTQTPNLWPLDWHDGGEFVLVYGSPDDLRNAEALSAENNPYRGLRPYEQRHAHLFFGRAALADQLRERIVQQRLTIVTGLSGVGKSSLLLAGALAPLLEPAPASRRNTPSSAKEEPWTMIGPVRPGTAPSVALDHAISKIGDAWGDGRIVLVLDQFEEVVSMCRDADAREAFLAFLDDLTSDSPSGASKSARLSDGQSALLGRRRQVHVVLTVRSDYEPHFLYDEQGRRVARYQRWQEARFPVLPMNREQLRQCIEWPAAVRALSFARGRPRMLVEKLLDEVDQMPGALPLLSVALSEMYLSLLKRGAPSRELDWEDYQNIGGGVLGALQKLVEEVYQLQRAHEAARPPPGTPEEVQDTMRRVFLRMVSLDGGELVRRRVDRDELDYGDKGENERVAWVVETLYVARLVVFSPRPSSDRSEKPDALVEPAHDALVRGWPRLLRWLDPDPAQTLALPRRLAQSAEDWEKGRGGLWFGRDAIMLRALAPAKVAGLLTRTWRSLTEWFGADYVLERMARWSFNGREREFIHQSLRRQQRTRWLTVLSVLAIFAIVATATGLAWWNIDRRGQEQAQYALALADNSRELAQTALDRDHDPVASLRLAAAALGAAAANHPRRSVIRAQVVTSALLAPSQAAQLGGPLGAAALSPQQRYFVALSPSGTPSVWDLTRLEKLPAPPLPAGWTRDRPAFSPSGDRVVVTVHVDGRTRMWTWDVTQPSTAHEIPVDESMVGARELQFVDDEHFVATATLHSQPIPRRELRLYSTTGTTPVRLFSGAFPASLNDGGIPISRVGQRTLALITPVGEYRTPSPLPDTLQAFDVSTGERVYEARVGPFIDAAWIPGRPAIIVERKRTHGPESEIAWTVFDFASGKQTDPETTIESAQCALRLDWPRLRVVDVEHVLVLCGNTLHSLSFDAASGQPFKYDYPFGGEVAERELWPLSSTFEPAWVWLRSDPAMVITVDKAGTLIVRDYSGSPATQRSVGKDVLYAALTSDGDFVVTIDAHGTLRWWSVKGDWDRCLDQSIFDLGGPTPRMMPRQSLGWLSERRAAVMHTAGREGCRIDVRDLEDGSSPPPSTSPTARSAVRCPVLQMRSSSTPH